MRWRRRVGPGEAIVVDTRPHWWYLAAPTSTLSAVIAGGIAATVSNTPPVIEWLVVAALMLSAAWLAVRYVRWSTTRLMVTTSRVLERRGLLVRTSREIPIAAISNIAYRQSFFDRLIGAGDIVIESAGRDSGEIFPDLPHPEIIQNQVFTEITRWRSAGWPNQPPAIGTPAGGSSRDGQPPIGRGPAASDGAGIPAQIDQLDQLRRRGVITEAEFQAKKAQLLERM